MTNIDERKSLGIRWYVAHTYSGYESKVKATLEKIIENRGLQDIITDICIPMDVWTEGEGENAKVHEQKRFPSYVYIKMLMCDESWHVVRNITGVTGFVGPGSEPEPLTNEEVDSLLGDILGAAEETIEIGSMVEIIGGVFTGYSGRLSEISPDGNEVTVIVSAVGRDMPIKAAYKEIKLSAEQ